MSFEEFFKDHNFRIMEILYKLINDGSISTASKLQAIEQFQNRTLGRPKQNVEVNSTTTVTTTNYDFTGLSDAALRELHNFIDAQVVEAQLIEDNREDGDA